MDLLGRWVRAYGRPLAWYSDRHGIFRAEDAGATRTSTQFSRALGELGIELILAHSPQAKGRVERLWGTAQDRLVKELRLAGARRWPRPTRCWSRCSCRGSTASASWSRPARNDATCRWARGTTWRRSSAPRSSGRWPTTTPSASRTGCTSCCRRRGRGSVAGRWWWSRRLDGSMRVRFKGRYLQYRESRRGQGRRNVVGGAVDWGLCPQTPGV